MKLAMLAACAVLAAAPAGQAVAEPITAKLATPVAEKTKFIAGGAVFVCEGDACVALVPTSQTFASSTCRAIAERVGVVTAFGARKVLDEGKLAACNAKARAKAAPATP